MSDMPITNEYLPANAQSIDDIEDEELRLKDKFFQDMWQELEYNTRYHIWDWIKDNILEQRKRTLKRLLKTKH